MLGWPSDWFVKNLTRVQQVALQMLGSSICSTGLNIFSIQSRDGISPFFEPKPKPKLNLSFERRAWMNPSLSGWPSSHISAKEFHHKILNLQTRDYFELFSKYVKPLHRWAYLLQARNLAKAFGPEPRLVPPLIQCWEEQGLSKVFIFFHWLRPMEAAAIIKSLSSEKINTDDLFSIFSRPLLLQCCCCRRCQCCQMHCCRCCCHMFRTENHRKATFVRNETLSKKSQMSPSNFFQLFKKKLKKSECYKL